MKNTTIPNLETQNSRQKLDRYLRSADETPETDWKKKKDKISSKIKTKLQNSWGRIDKHWRYGKRHKG